MASKLNKRGTQKVPTYPTLKNVPLEQTRAVSANGNVQWQKEPLQHLYELTVSTLFGKDTFYKSSDQLVTDLKANVSKAVQMDAFDFVANLAVHARIQMHIRTIPIVLVVEFASALRNQNKQYSELRRVVCDVIQRADQITDLYSYALEVFGSKKAVPMAIKRGVADAFLKFNAYSFAKYNRDGTVKFRDVLRIVHPVAKTDEQGSVFEKIMQEQLESPYTWEVELSRNGQLSASERKTDKQLWTELVSSGKMGYMALLRNLRNILQADVPLDVLKEHVAAVLSDKKRVSTSKQFPFAYVQAKKAISGLPNAMTIERALNAALEHSTDNIPTLGNRVALVVDVSGSMGSGASAYGFRPSEMASMLAAALVKSHRNIDSLDIILFASSAQRIQLNPDDSMMSIAQNLERLSTGGSTNFEAGMQAVAALPDVPDAVVVLTDGEIDGIYGRPVRLPTETVKVVVNLNAVNSTPLPQRDGWYALSGWSNNMFRFIPAIKEKTTIVELLSVPFAGAAAMKQALVEPEAETA